MWHLEIDDRRVKDLWPVRFVETERCNTNNSLSLASQALMIRIANEARITHRGWKASGLNASTPSSSLKAELELPKSPSKRQGFAKDNFDFQLVRHDIRTVCVHRPRTCVIGFCPWIAASALPTWSSSLNKWTASNIADCSRPRWTMAQSTTLKCLWSCEPEKRPQSAVKMLASISLPYWLASSRRKKS